LASKDAELARKEAMEALRASFRPEFINRIDEIVIFNPLGREQLKSIVGMLLKNVEKLLRSGSHTGADARGARVFAERRLRSGIRRAASAAHDQRLIQDPLACRFWKANPARRITCAWTATGRRT